MWQSQAFTLYYGPFRILQISKTRFKAYSIGPVTVMGTTKFCGLFSAFNHNLYSWNLVDCSALECSRMHYYTALNNIQLLLRQCRALGYSKLYFTIWLQCTNLQSTWLHALEWSTHYQTTLKTFDYPTIVLTGSHLTPLKLAAIKLIVNIYISVQIAGYTKLMSTIFSIKPFLFSKTHSCHKVVSYRDQRGCELVNECIKCIRRCK